MTATHRPAPGRVAGTGGATRRPRPLQREHDRSSARATAPHAAPRSSKSHNIEVIYNAIALVLKGVSLNVPKGGIVALLGANGAGKTTTLKAISNLLRAERGEVTKGAIMFEGERVDRLSPNDLVRRGAIQVMEGRHCFGHLTIEENLLTGAFTRRDGRAAIARDLEAIYAYFPAPQGAAPDVAGRLHVRRRTADVRDRPGDDVAPEAGPARRAVDGPRAAGGRGDFRDREGPQRARRRVVPARRAEHQHRAALCASFGYILETGRVVLDGAAEALRANEDVREFYLGVAGEDRRSFKTSRPTSAASAGWPEGEAHDRRSPASSALRDRLGELHGRSHALARQIGDLDISTLRSPADLALIPVLRKSALAEMQRAEPPFGALAAAPTGAFPRLFASPGGDLRARESAGDDPWGAAKAFAAAGVQRGEIVVNCFSYHLTPGGRILESGALALGCPVIPAGPGNTEQLIAAIAHLRPSVYAGPPDFLKIVLDKARAAGADASSIRKALVSGAALPPSLRAELEAAGVRTRQCYATADLGVIAWETDDADGRSCRDCWSTTT